LIAETDNHSNNSIITNEDNNSIIINALSQVHKVTETVVNAATHAIFGGCENCAYASEEKLNDFLECYRRRRPRHGKCILHLALPDEFQKKLETHSQNDFCLFCYTCSRSTK
jgi:hypothetical protein